MIDEGYLYEKEEPKSGFLRHAGSGRQSPAQTSSSYDDYSTRNNTDGNDMSSLSPSNREHANPRMRDRSHRYASSQSSHSRHKQQQQRDMPNAIASASRPPRYRSHRNQHQPQPPPTQHAARPSHVSHGPSHDHTTSRNRSKGTSGDRGGRGGDVDRDRDRGGEGEGEREGREGREKREKRARKREKEEQSMRTSAKSTGTVKENPVAMLNQHLRKKHQMGVERETGRKRGGDRESMYARRAHTSGTRHRLSGADTISNRMNNNNSGNDQGNTPNTVTDDEGGNDGGEADGGGMSSDFRRRMSTNERRILLQKERRKALERKVGDSNTDGARSNDIDSGRSHTKNVNSKSKGGRLIEGRDGNKKSRNEGGDGKNSADGVEDGQTTYRKLAAAAKKKEKDKDKHSYMFRMAKMAKTVVKSISNYSADSDTDADTDADVDTGVAHGTSAGADAGAMGGNGDHGTGRGRGAEATQGDGKDNDGSDRSADGFTALTKTRGYAKKTGKPVHSVHNLHIPRTRQKTDGRRAGDSYSHNNPRQGYNGNSRYNRSLNHDGYSPRQNESRGSNTSHAHTDRHSYLRSQAQSHARQGGPRSHGLRPPDSISEHPYHRESGSDDHIHDLDGDNAHADARAYMHADKRLDNAAGGRESENPPSLLRGLDKQRSLDYSSYNHQKFPFTPKHRRPSSRALSNNTTRTVYRNDNSSRPELEDKENSHSHKRTSANHHNHNPNHLRSHTRTHHHDRGDLHSHRSHEGAATSEIARSYAKGGGRESLVRFDDQTEAEGAVMTKPLPALQEESLRATPVDDSPSVPASFSSPSSSPSSLPSSTAVPASPTAAQGSMQVPPFAPDRDDDSSMKNTHGGSSGSDDAMGDHARDYKHVAGAGLEHDSTSSSNYTNTEFEDKIFGYRGLKKHKKKPVSLASRMQATKRHFHGKHHLQLPSSTASSTVTSSSRSTSASTTPTKRSASRDNTHADVSANTARHGLRGTENRSYDMRSSTHQTYMNALRIGDTNISDGLSIGDDASVWEARFAELTETVVVLRKQLDDSVFENEYVEASIGDNGGSKGKSKTVRVGEEDDEEVRRLPLKRRVVRLEKMVKESNNAVAGLKEKIRLLETQNEELSTQQQKQGKKADNGDASADAGNTTTMGSVIMDYLLVLFSLCVMGLFTMIAPLVKLYNSKQKKNDKRSQLDKDTSHLATLWGMISTCMDHTATLVVFIRDWTVQCFSEEGIFGFMCGCCRDGTKDAQDAQIHANHSGRFRVMNRGDKGEAHERMIDKSLRKRGHRSKLKTKRRTWQSSRKALSDAYSGSGIDDNKERGRDKDREKDRYNDRERESNRGPMETPDSYTGIYSVGVDRDSGNHTPHRGTDTDEYGAGMGAGMSINLLAASNVDKGSVGSAYSGTLKEEGAISQPRSNPDLHSRNNSSFGGADVDMDTLLNHIHSNNDTDDTNEREKDLVFDHTDNITDPRSSTGTNDRQDYSQRSSPCLSPALSKQQYSPISLILNDPHDPFPFDDAYTQARGRVQSLGHSRGSSMNSLSNVPSQKQDGGRAKLEDTHDVVTSGHEFAEFLRENF